MLPWLALKPWTIWHPGATRQHTLHSGAHLIAWACADNLRPSVCRIVGGSHCCDWWHMVGAERQVAGTVEDSGAAQGP